MFYKNIYKILLFLALTLFFSFLIFFTKNYFFGGIKEFEIRLIEEKYIEPTLNDFYDLHGDEFLEVDNDLLNKKIQEKIISKFNSATNKIKYFFVPESFVKEEFLFFYFDPIDTFLNKNYIINKINNIEIIFYKLPGEVRGNIRNKKIRLFGLERMGVRETLSVLVHEFGHYIDLYYFENNRGVDISNLFYDISWNSTTVIKPGLTQDDFVSGYSMTNKYEDFAESFTYYVLHNSDFLEKTKNSDILKQKYDFFLNYLFTNNEFVTDEYKIIAEIKNYYRDITKIEFSLENFLQYLKK